MLTIWKAETIINKNKKWNEVSWCYGFLEWALQKNKILIRKDRYGYAGLSFVSLPITAVWSDILPYEPVSYALYRWKEMLEHSCNAVFFYYFNLDFFRQKITGNVPVSGQCICDLYFISRKCNFDIIGIILSWLRKESTVKESRGQPIKGAL